MATNRQPHEGNGFIYILSNPSMPSVYKVGLTTSSVRQRILELSTTGVPRPFQAERVFEIPESHLRSVERLAHKKLKRKDLHHGKEFFEGSLHDCVTAVEDAIYEITQSVSVDLVGQASQRASAEDRRREDERRARELAKEKRVALEKRVNDFNREVDAKRARYVEEFASGARSRKSFMDRLVWEPLGVLLIAVIAMGVMSVGGPLAWIGVPLFLWWLYDREKSEALESHRREAAVKFPYATPETIDNHRPAS